MAAQIQNGGKASFAAAVLAQGTSKFGQWGTGGASPAPVTANAVTTAAAPTTTTAVTGAQSVVTTTVTNDTLRIIFAITAAGTVTINEVMVLNQATISGATGIAYTDHGAQTLGVGDSITYQLDIQFS